MFKKRKNFGNGRKRGFSMIELLVTISILIVVSGLVFFNQSRFHSNILIENLAYEISLTIRQAQSYGLQTKESEGGFSAGYGVRFDVTENDKFIFYADKDGNHIYDTNDVIVDELKMTNKNKINKLCASANCSEGEVDMLNIAFIRPDPDAYINTNKEIGEIYIISARGEQEKITVNEIGQISIESI